MYRIFDIAYLHWCSICQRDFQRFHGLSISEDTWDSLSTPVGSNYLSVSGGSLFTWSSGSKKTIPLYGVLSAASIGSAGVSATLSSKEILDSSLISIGDKMSLSESSSLPPVASLSLISLSWSLLSSVAICYSYVSATLTWLSLFYLRTELICIAFPFSLLVLVSSSSSSFAV